MSIVAHLGSLPGARQALKAYYEDRIDLPSTPKTGIALGDDGKVKDSGYAMPEVAGASLFDSGNSRRTRMVGFPDFMAINVSGADLGAIVLILGVMSRVGLGVEAVESASISVPVAESYGLPAAWMLDAWNRSMQSASDKQPANGEQPKNDEQLGGRDCATKLRLTAAGKEVELDWEALETLATLDRDEQEFARTDSTGAAGNKLYLSLVSEVYMTRAIDASVSFRQSAVAGLQRDRGAEPTSSGSADAASACAEGASTPADAASTSKAEAGAPAGDKPGADGKADAPKPAAGSASFGAAEAKCRASVIRTEQALAGTGDKLVQAVACQAVG